MKYAQAFAPGHITGLFSIQDHAEDPLDRGSLGAGFCLSLGVTTRLEASLTEKDTVFINGQVEAAPVSRSVLRHFFTKTGAQPRPFLIRHTTELPMGSGFGTSGAGALSLALALNQWHGSPLKPVQAADLAHLAEIENKTGLGTVVGEWAGGFEIRQTAGAPSRAKVGSFSYPTDLLAACLVWGPYPTPGMLRDPEIRERVNSAGTYVLEALSAQPDLPTFCKLSREFTRRSGLGTPEILKVIHHLDENGLDAAMLMFGQGLFCLTTPDKWEHFQSITSTLAPEARSFACSIDAEGGRLA